MKVYRVYEMQDLKAVGEKFYSLEKLTEFLVSKKAYFKHLAEPITEESIIENITDTYCADVIIPKNTEESLWEMMGLPNEDTVLRIFELDIIK